VKTSTLYKKMNEFAFGESTLRLIVPVMNYRLWQIILRGLPSDKLPRHETLLW
jgi:hypothetical protein